MWRRGHDDALRGCLLLSTLGPPPLSAAADFTLSLLSSVSQVIWQVINHGHCTYKVKTITQVRRECEREVTAHGDERHTRTRILNPPRSLHFPLRFP